LRPVHGDAGLYAALQEDILSNSKNSGIFIAYLVSNALSHRPPLGFFRNLVLIHGGDHKNTLDIKHRGITPIVDIARIYALSEGLPAVNTNERLKLACEAGALSAEMYASLADAFELISTLRIQHQVNKMIRGLPPDNYLSPNELSKLERSHLKDAFSIIKILQEALANRYQSGRLG
jgi:CBS domain-containing protein